MTAPADLHSQMACEAPISSASSPSSVRAPPPPPPRVYVPLNNSDSAMPTYAVLEFVGFSSPASTSSISMAMAPHLMSTMQQHTSPHLRISAAAPPLRNHHHSAASTLPLCLPPLSFTPNLLISPRSDGPSSFPQLTMPSAAASSPSAQIVQLFDSPPISPSSSSAAAGAQSRAAANDRVSEPPLLTISTPSPSSSSSSGMKKLSMAGSENMGPVSISQTDRETIVHTNSSNFKDVVRQLTGASSQDQDLMPVTLPARLANRVSAGAVANSGGVAIAAAAGAPSPGNCLDPSSKLLPDSSSSVAAARSDGSNRANGTEQQLGLRKAPLKLHERRKALRNLERLSTTAIAAAGASFRTEMSSSYSSTSSSPVAGYSLSPKCSAGYSVSPNCSATTAPVPSPVTPLASDFERFCNATTPTAAAGHHAMGVVCSPRDAISSSPRYNAAASACSPRHAEDGVYAAATRSSSGGRLGVPLSSSPRMMVEEGNKRGSCPLPPPLPPLFMPPSPHQQHNQQQYHHALNLNNHPGSVVSAAPLPDSTGPVLLNLFPDSPARGPSS